MFRCPHCGISSKDYETICNHAMTCRNRPYRMKNIATEDFQSHQSEKKKGMTKMQEDMQKMLASGEDSDVILKVQEKEFSAHRNILKARSPVFKSMFSHDTLESQSGEVIIEDSDSSSFPDFLTYVYTGSSQHLGASNVCSLYTTADKYCLGALKEDCVAFMKDNLSEDSFCDFIALALQHEEQELIELATKFFCDHFKSIITTVKWQNFLLENTIVGNELFIKATVN